MQQGLLRLMIEVAADVLDGARSRYVADHRKPGCALCKHNDRMAADVLDGARSRYAAARRKTAVTAVR